MGDRGLSWVIVVDRRQVVGSREVFEHVQKPGFDRRGLWRSCVVFSRSETDVQPSYDGRRWSWVVADIFWSPGSYIGRRLAARPSYDGRRAVGDF